jgi:hypothetical protein
MLAGASLDIFEWGCKLMLSSYRQFAESGRDLPSLADICRIYDEWGGGGGGGCYTHPQPPLATPLYAYAKSPPPLKVYWLAAE